MAGFIIYSLDWPKFQKLVESPDPKQLKVLAGELSAELEQLEGEFDDDDPILEWPTDAKSLASIVAKRLAMPDWYGDLSRVGKELWEGTFYGACMNCKGLNVDFRVDSDGVYWDVIGIARDALKVPPNQVTSVAMSTFGTRPFRYHGGAKQKVKFGDWSPMHSMHPPEEVQRMVQELESIKPSIDAADDEVQRQYEEELLPALTKIAKDGRMLFIQVDT
ncbi:MAG TPA: hypothetical protein VMP01_29890 [Pirellulaceae bacterium]|nr:hypothetical protein [Pirellulaceae bacterium]